MNQRYHEIYTTKNGLAQVAIYHGGGNVYKYVEISREGKIVFIDSLYGAHKNEYYLDYLTLFQLNAIDELLTLVSPYKKDEREVIEEKKETEIITEGYRDDDIPF